MDEHPPDGQVSGGRAPDGQEPDESAFTGSVFTGDGTDQVDATSAGLTDDDWGPDDWGPYDIADFPAGPERVDLGSLHLPVIEGVEVRVQADADGLIQQVALAHGDSVLQLGVFAAPRSEGIWHEVRADIRKSLSDDGAAVEEIAGDYGKELRARVRTPEGPMVVRFVGVDGPRWMVRAVYQGPAATDPLAAGPLTACLRGLVVDRGRDAMPVRDPLPLRLPRDVTEQARAQAATDPAAMGTVLSGAADGTPTGNGRPDSGSPGSGRPGSGRPDSAGPTNDSAPPRRRRR